MSTLIETLMSFNRKERFHLMGMALGNAGFQLSEEFRGELSSAIDAFVPADAFCAMDYHLDWLYAALYLWSPDSQSTIVDNPLGHINGNQEDVDLLVAFEKGTIIHLVLLEAKGATSWTNKPMRSKAERLRLIFGKDGDDFPGIEPHFVLTSRKPPTQRLRVELWPQWMRGRDGGLNWFQLDWPENLVKVTRCGTDGKPSYLGKYWKLVPTP